MKEKTNRQLSNKKNSGFNTIEVLTGISIGLIILGMIGFIWQIPGCINKIEKEGMKTIIEEIWYGKETKKELPIRCQDCEHYSSPKCKLTDEFTTRKNKCEEFKRTK